MTRALGGRVRVDGVDVVLSAYSGLTVVPAWFLAVRVYARFDGLEGLAMLADSGRYALATMAVLLFLWCSAHVMLPVPALAAAIGIRFRQAWGRDLGMALGLLMLLLVPLGTLVGLYVLLALYWSPEAFESEAAA